MSKTIHQDCLRALADHGDAQESYYRRREELVKFLSQRVNPRLKEYGVKVSFDARDISVMNSLATAYIEGRIVVDNGEKRLRGHLKDLTRYVWELISGCLYEKGAVYNVRYHGGRLPYGTHPSDAADHGVSFTMKIDTSGV